MTSTSVPLIRGLIRADETIGLARCDRRRTCAMRLSTSRLGLKSLTFAFLDPFREPGALTPTAFERLLEAEIGTARQ